jgi:hypothetical protein
VLRLIALEIIQFEVETFFEKGKETSIANVLREHFPKGRAINCPEKVLDVSFKILDVSLIHEFLYSADCCFHSTITATDECEATGQVEFRE